MVSGFYHHSPTMSVSAEIHPEQCAHIKDRHSSRTVTITTCIGHLPDASFGDSKLLTVGPTERMFTGPLRRIGVIHLPQFAVEIHVGVWTNGGRFGSAKTEAGRIHVKRCMYLCSETLFPPLHEIYRESATGLFTSLRPLALEVIRSSSRTNGSSSSSPTSNDSRLRSPGFSPKLAESQCTRLQTLRNSLPVLWSPGSLRIFSASASDITRSSARILSSCPSILRRLLVGNCSIN